MNSIILDTNAFIRILLNDIPAQADEVEKIIKEAKKGKVTIYIPQNIIFEIHFILLKYYKLQKEEVINQMKSLISAPYFMVEKRDIFLEALSLYQQDTNSLADHFIYVIAKKEGCEFITFDKKLKKLV